MRRVVVLLLLLGGMLGLELLKAEPVTVGDPLTLAAIGFVVLAAFTIAEVGQALTLPRVTGFILTGIALGPYASDILSETVVAEMRMFNTLALGLIATTAGLELDVKALRSVWRTLFSTVGVKLVVVLPLVAGLFYALETGFGFLGLSGAAIPAVSLLVGTFALGTSPSVTLAVLSETRAKGRLSDLILGAAVLKDLVVVVVLAITVAVARSLVSPGATLDASVFAHVGRELGFTIVVGALLGALFIVYIRFVHAEMLLFVAAMILVTAELSHALHLELLLVFIVAGFVVRNFSHFEHELHAPLQMVSLPVFVVFFTIAGASVDLRVLVGLLPVALALSAARAGAFWVAGRVGGAVGAETPAVRRGAWLGYLPLAGVTLGLVGLAALRIPELATPITSLGMAFVAVNLLAGPIALRGALSRAGEVPEVPSAPPKPVAQVAPVSEEAEELNVDVELARARALLDDPELSAALDRAHRDLSDVLARFASDAIDPWSKALRSAAVHAVVPEERKVEALRDFAEGADSDEDPSALAESVTALFADLQGRLRALPAVVQVPLAADAHRIEKKDGLATRYRRRWLRIQRLATFGRARRTRDVPARMLARIALEPRLARLSLDTLGTFGRAYGRVIEELRRFSAGDVPAEEAREAIEAELEGLRERFIADARAALARGLRHFAELAGRAGGPALPARRIRYSSVEPEVSEALARIFPTATAWGDRTVAARQTLLLWIHLASVEATLERVFHDDVLRPLEEACNASAPKVEMVLERVAEVRKDLPADQPLSKDALGELQRACAGALPTSVQAELRLARARFARATATRDLALELRALVDSLPDKLVVLRPGAAVHTAANPEDVAVHTVNLRAIAGQKLVSEFLPSVDSSVSDISLRIATVSSRLREAIDVAAHTLEPGPDGEGTDPEFVARGIARALERLGEVQRDLEDVRSRAAEDLRARARAVQSDLRVHALSEGASELRIVHVDTAIGAFVRALRDRVRPRWQRARALYRGMLEELRRLRGSELSRDIQIRYARTALDAGAMRAYLTEWADTSHIPQSYLRLFSLEPLRERRFFIANRAELGAVIRTEHQWADGDGPSSALIVGRHGSGMTSLLNLCQVELKTRRVFRPDWALAKRTLGVLPLLADDLGCDPDEQSVIAALSAQRTVVLIDDLQSWVTPDSAGVDALERLLEVIVATRAQVFWIVAVEQEAFSLMEEALSVRQAFGHVVQLGPPPLDTLMALIEARHRLSGFELEYPSTLASRILSRFRRTSEREIFFRVLAGATDGNLRLSLIAWRRAVRQPDGPTVAPSLQRVLAVGLPFVAMLPVRAAAILVQLSRFGPLDAAWLAYGAGLAPGEGERNLGFLENAGLIEPIDPGRPERRIPVAVQEAVLRGLREVGAVRPGGLR